MLDYELEHFLSNAATHEATAVGVVLRGEHRVMYFGPTPDPIDPLGMIAWFACSCGWKKHLRDRARLTTKSPLVRECLREHALSFTDPNHYTYYPQGV